MEVTAAEKAGSYNSPEVDELITRCQSGTLQAFDELVARYQRFVFTVVYQHLGSTDEIEDIAQEVFLRVFKFIGRYRGQASFETWLYKVALNYIRTHQRRRSLLGRFFIELPERTDDSGRSFDMVARLADDARDPAHSDEHRRIVEEIMQVVRSLPPMYRDVLIMREVNELSYDEISEILGVSMGTVKSRLNRARQLVRRKVTL
jgi:RNA polymerase sigma-70 factor (ECF subfamily)